MTTDAVQLAREEFIAFVTQPERRVDPYPFYREIQSAAPVHEIDTNIWLAASYDAVSDALRDDRFGTDESKSTESQGLEKDAAPTAFSRVYQNMLLFRDEPDHKRLRDLVQKAFTRRVVEDLKPRIVALVDELVTSLIDRESADLMSELAYPAPVIVICDLLGVPASDRHLFHDWARDLASRMEVKFMRTPEMEARGDAATENLIDFFDALIAKKRANPENDLLSALVAVEEAGDRLTHDELLGTCILILLAGHETTANLIGNGTLALLRNRDQWDRLTDDPSLARSAVEELLRYDTPVQMVMRVTLADVELSGRSIPAGAMVAPMLGAANRDPNHFPDPDTLDITRGDAPLVAFGGGIHFCLGAPLARLEAKTAFSALASKVPKLELEAEPEWRTSFVLRGLQSLPVRLN